MHVIALLHISPRAQRRDKRHKDMHSDMHSMTLQRKQGQPKNLKHGNFYYIDCMETERN